MTSPNESPPIEKPDIASPRLGPVLCREEAMVYVENYVRGDRDRDDLAALSDFFRLLPLEEYPWYPFDVPTLIEQIEAELQSS